MPGLYRPLQALRGPFTALLGLAAGAQEPGSVNWSIPYPPVTMGVLPDNGLYGQKTQGS
jgi:hypothetical protein